MRTSLSPGATLSILSTYSLALSCLPLSHRYIPALYSAWSQQAQWRHVRLYIGIYIHVQCLELACPVETCENIHRYLHTCTAPGVGLLIGDMWDYIRRYLHTCTSKHVHVLPPKESISVSPSLPALLSNSLSGGACTQEKQPLIKNERTHVQPTMLLVLHLSGYETTVLLVLHLSGYETTYLKAAAARSQTED